MKIEVNIDKKILMIVIGIFLIGAGVYAYNASGTGGTPNVAGHSVDEMDWSKTISEIKTNNLYTDNAYFKDGYTYYAASYYVGIDNNGNDNPDCWLDSGAGSGSTIYDPRLTWGGCDNVNQSCCAQTSLSRKKTALNDAGGEIDSISLIDYSDTGGSAGYDGSSDRLLVNVWIGYSNNKGSV